MPASSKGKGRSSTLSGAMKKARSGAKGAGAAARKSTAKGTARNAGKTAEKSAKKSTEKSAEKSAEKSGAKAAPRTAANRGGRARAGAAAAPAKETGTRANGGATKGGAKEGANGGAASGAPLSAADAEALVAYYREMLLIRRFEERAGQLYGMGLIGGFCHLYIGQEAVVVGMQATLTPDDAVITSYRDHGHMLACGMEPRGVMAELTGRRSGYSKGKGGSMHMFSREKNFYGGHGIVAAQVPIGAGLAFAQKYNDTGGVTLTYFGDGAVNQGQVHEALNMAALWSLPVVFVIENNKYGMGTSVDRASAMKDLCRVGEPLGIEGRQVDGMDVLAVRDAGAEAVAACRAGDGPAVLEMMTYRYRGHSMSDPAKYRTKEEVNKMRTEHDPIDMARERLIAGGHADEDALKEIDREVRALVAEAAEFAQNSPEPDPAELYTDVLAEAGA